MKRFLDSSTSQPEVLACLNDRPPSTQTGTTSLDITARRYKGPSPDLHTVWRTAMGAVREHGQPRVEDPARLDDVVGVGVGVGVDETPFQVAAATRSTSFVTGIVDLIRGRGPARLLDVVEGRSTSALVSWVAERDPAWRAGIATAALDPYRGYASALRTALPDAVRVLDAFHVVRLGFSAVDDVRRRIQNEQTGHRGRRDDPLYGIRRLLRRRHDHHSDRSWARLPAGLDAGDTADEQLARTWVAAQYLRLIYHAGDRARAEQALYRWLAYCADADIPELTRLARTIDSWRAEFLAYFDTGGMSNGPTEADQEDQAGRARVPQLRQLPAPPTPALRRRLGHYPRYPDQRTATTLSGAEPLICCTAAPRGPWNGGAREAVAFFVA